MKYEAEGYRVIPPEDADRSKLQRVIDLGFQRRKVVISEIQQARDRLFINSKSTEYLINKILNLGLSQDEADLALRNVLGQNLTKQFEEAQSPGMHFEQPPLIEEVISSQKKNEIVEPVVLRIRRFGQRNGVKIPSNLSERLYVVNEDLFNLITMGNGDISNDLDPVGIMGVTLLGRLSIIDIEKIKRNANEEGIDQEKFLELVIAHELWHSLAYGEEWVKKIGENTDFNLIRRSGFTTMRYGDMRNPSIRDHVKLDKVLHDLEEGFTHYLALISLGQNLDENIIYSGETKEVMSLIDEIGFDSFLKAYFTKKGFKDLMIGLRTYVGRRVGRQVTYAQALQFVDLEIKRQE